MQRIKAREAEVFVRENAAKIRDDACLAKESNLHASWMQLLQDSMTLERSRAEVQT